MNKSGHSSRSPSVARMLGDRLVRIYGAEVAERILESMRAPKATAYVVNGLCEVDFAPLGAPVPGLAGCYSVSSEARQALLDHPAVGAGAFYPMNPSSTLAPRALGVDATMEVLDLAAAPGGKTLLLAMDMNNGGRIAAVEPVKARFHRMRANLARCHVTNVRFYQADGRSIGRKVPERFDRVLLDAPCSSEARIRLDEAASFAHWKPRKIRETSRKQRGLIRSAYQALKPGGVLVYCTCAFSPEENELVVDHLLRAEPTAEILPLDGPGMPGLTGWGGSALDPRLEGCLRVLPDSLFDGFFLARIRRNG